MELLHVYAELAAAGQPVHPAVGDANRT